MEEEEVVEEEVLRKTLVFDRDEKSLKASEKILQKMSRKALLRKI